MSRRCASSCRVLFPGMTFAFLPADIVSQILNFGAPAPIDLQIRGANLTANFAYANKLLSRIRRIPGIADARIQQSPNNPSFNIDVDRTRAQYVGLTERDVTNASSSTWRAAPRLRRPTTSIPTMACRIRS